MAVDHVVPERLIAHPEERVAVDHDYALSDAFPDFAINSLQNWVPTHGGAGCNARKGGELFNKATTLYYLGLVHRNLPRVEAELFLLRKNRQKDNMLGQLAVAREHKIVSQADILGLVASMEQYFEKVEPLLIAFGLNVYELFEENLLPDDAPLDFPDLYDWLEEHLEAQLKASVSTPFHQTELSLRDGECLTVRIVFPDVNPSEIPRHPDPNWEILEVFNFYDIYGIPYSEAFLETEWGQGHSSG